MINSDQHSFNKLRAYHSSLGIALIYLCFSGIWIYFGDSLLLRYFSDPNTLTKLQTIKGLLFVCLSALLILVLVNNALNKAARLQQALREKEENLRVLLENQNELIVKIDHLARIQFVSASYSTVFGKAAQQVLGRSFIPPIGMPGHQEISEAIKVLRDPLDTTYFEQWADTVKGHRWLGWSGRGVFSDNGRLTAIILTGRDITDNKETLAALDESEKKFRKLFEKSVDAIFIVDKTTGRYLDANLAATELTGYSVSQLKEKTTRDLTPTNAGNRLETIEKAKNSMDLGLVTYHRSDGNYRIARLHTIAVDESRVFGIAHDITALKEAEKSLKLKSEEMENFVYVVSHDLKSPLITIKTFLGLLEKDIDNTDREKITQDLEFISGATEKIEAMLEALLQLSRIGRLDSRVQQVSVNKLVAECLAVLAGPLEQRRVKISVADIPYELHGDPLHFGQLWQNLIENAIKYMGNQLQPQISVGVEGPVSEPVFFVRDNGMGILDEHHQRIFTIFTQLSRASDGTGLGLSLVKKIVEQYQGKIWVESAGEGQGSCFRFTLPTALKKVA